MTDLSRPGDRQHPDRASFLQDPEVDEHVVRMYDGDLEGQGYVANLTRVWAHSPDSLLPCRTSSSSRRSGPASTHGPGRSS